MEEWFFTKQRWKQGEECLNLEDINYPPSKYGGGFREWICDLTTFIALYPKEWKEIYREYLEEADCAGKCKNKSLSYFRDVDGSLRKKEERDIYLRIRLECGKDEVIQLSRKIMWQSLFGFEEYVHYCRLTEIERKCYQKELQEVIRKEIGLYFNTEEKKNEMKLSFEEDFDNAGFDGKDVYIDALNDNYIIL